MASNVNDNVSVTTNPLIGLLLPDVVIQQRYRILEVLSTGEVSTLYKAEDSQLGNRFVSLREIGRNNQNTQEALELIEANRREMLLLADLSHPHLPRIYDYFVENQRWYFVMDFLVGETLEGYLRQRKFRPLPIEEVLDAGIQLSTVLDYLQLHQPPFVFTDLALSDIWRTPDGKLYLLDIGSAPSATASMLGNSSIANLGKILRQLQTGKTPTRPRLYLARPRFSTGAKHFQTTALNLLLQQMMHKNVHKRPYTMGVVKQELQHLIAQSMPPPALKKRLYSRRTFFKLGGLAGFAGLATISSFITWQLERQAKRQFPKADYSPHLGGTINTYIADSGVTSVVWSPSGTRLAIGTWGGGQVQSFDANTGRHVITYPDDNNVSGGRQIYALLWLPDGTTIVFGDNSATIGVVNALTGNVEMGYSGHTAGVITVANSPDGTYIASGGYDQTVQIWEVATGSPLVTYHGHTNAISSVAWSPDGTYIASASFDETVQIWEAATGRTLYTYQGHTDEVYTVAWSPDGKHIASAGRDQTVQVWAVTLFEQAGVQGKGNSSILMYRGHTTSVQAVAWSPNSTTIASAGGDVQLWNSLTGQYIFTYTKHATSNNSEVLAVAWSPNGKYIASGGIEGTAQIWHAV